MPRELVLVHYNDVYNVEPSAPKKNEDSVVGGAARLATLIERLVSSQANPLVLFSGDAFNPSAMSTVTKGKHLVPVLNSLHTAVTVMGNHDLDFGLENYLELTKQTTFPWLLSNVFDKASGQPYANSPRTHKITHGGVSFGFVGLVEDEWLATLGAVDPVTIEYRDMFETGSALATQLRAEGCEYIIALTHSRLPNDELLAERCPEIDMICGGHDHDYVVKQHGPHNTWIVKSGTDFRALTELRLVFRDEAGAPKGSVTVVPTKHETLFSVPEDPAMKAIVDSFMEARERELRVPIGDVECELDARFSTVRTKESNAGNLVCDVLRDSFHNPGLKADCALINGGLLRADAVQGPGPYTLKHLTDLLPMATQAVLLGVPGALFPSILENAVSKFPVLEGRFAQVSGIHFDYDSEQPAGSRVLKDSIKVKGEALDAAAVYKIVTTAYLASGKDGYDAFAHKDVKILVDEENGVTVPTAVLNYFRHQHVISAFKLGGSKHTIGDDLVAHKICPAVEGRIHNIRGEPRVTKQDLAARQIQRIARARQGRARVRAIKLQKEAALLAEHGAVSVALIDADEVEKIAKEEEGAAKADDALLAAIAADQAAADRAEALEEDAKLAEAEALAAEVALKATEAATERAAAELRAAQEEEAAAAALRAAADAAEAATAAESASAAAKELRAQAEKAAEDAQKHVRDAKRAVHLQEVLAAAAEAETTSATLAAAAAEAAAKAGLEVKEQADLNVHTLSRHRHANVASPGSTSPRVAPEGVKVVPVAPKTGCC